MVVVVEVVLVSVAGGVAVAVEVFVVVVERPAFRERPRTTPLFRDSRSIVCQFARQPRASIPPVSIDTSSISITTITIICICIRVGISMRIRISISKYFICSPPLASIPPAQTRNQ